MTKEQKFYNNIEGKATLKSTIRTVKKTAGALGVSLDDLMK